MIFENGHIYTLDEHQPQVEAVAVAGGKIIYAGTKKGLKRYQGDNTRMVDLHGQTMTPGFIESHGHFMAMGNSKLVLDLTTVHSYAELVDRVADAVSQTTPGEWIIGRGWHQSKWDSLPARVVKGFPVHDSLSAVSPDNPVLLYHASGHAGMANARAMEIAGVLPLDKEGVAPITMEGGEIIRDEQGNPTGLFNERAMGLISKNIPDASPESDAKAFRMAVENCWKNGITMFVDAGATRKEIELYQKKRKTDSLGVRMYAMLTGRDPALLDEWYVRGPQIDTAIWLTIRSIKLNCDGALGSRGAWLLEPYSDMPGEYGHETLPMSFVRDVSEKGLKYGFQVCSHAIGDRTNREVLDRYEQAFLNNPDRARDHRYRIEHAQHLSLQDIPRFGELHVIASMQAIHMSSDRSWAIDRLGERRIKEGAYVWRKLMDSGAIICNGTDVPVEPIDPIACFYASVTRKSLDGTPEGGYEPDQKMTRQEALQSYTSNAAYAAFQEGVLGSIETGKLADFTVFSQDIMTVPEEELLSTRIAMTVINGKIVYAHE